METLTLSIIVLAYVFAGSTWSCCSGSDKVCNDTLIGSTCQHLANNNACDTHPVRMTKLCAKTCNYCSMKTPCHGVRCPYKQICSLTSNREPVCRCHLVCHFGRLTGPVCGSNRRTYDSLCLLREDECRHSLLIGVQHYGNCIQQESCTDLTLRCEQFKLGGLCKKEQRIMEFYCAKTCKLCRQAAPLPSCARSKFGCCWNSNREALGTNQIGCKVCKDRGFCKSFIPICGGGRNRAIMRELCPVACGYCKKDTRNKPTSRF